MDKKHWQYKLIIVFFYLFLFLILAKNSFSYLDPDFGWHIAVGKQILTDRSVPHLDYYNFPLNGAEWVDHEWLFNATIYWLYDSVGYAGLNIIFALLVVLTLALLHRFTLKFFSPRNPRILIAILLLSGMYASLPSLGVRLQELAILFLLLVVMIIEAFDRKRQPMTLLWLIPLFAIWANLHGSFLIGLFIIPLWLSFKLIFPLTARWHWPAYFQKDQPLSRQDFRRVITVFVLSVGATFLTPYNYKLYSFLTDYGNSYYLKHINEWLPAWAHPVFIHQTILLAVAASLFGLYFLSLRSSPSLKKLPPWQFFLSLFFYGPGHKIPPPFSAFFHRFLSGIDPGG